MIKKDCHDSIMDDHECDLRELIGIVELIKYGSVENAQNVLVQPFP